MRSQKHKHNRALKRQMEQRHHRVRARYALARGFVRTFAGDQTRAGRTLSPRDLEILRRLFGDEA